MESSPRVLLKIRAMSPQLSSGYRRIADYICAHPEKVVECKVREIAAACGCDDARVVRFCQKCGFAGIHELRSSLALEFMPVRPRGKEAQVLPSPCVLEPTQVKGLHLTYNLSPSAYH